MTQEDGKILYENDITNFDSSHSNITFNPTVVYPYIKVHPQKEIQFKREIRYPKYMEAFQAGSFGRYLWEIFFGLFF